MAPIYIIFEDGVSPLFQTAALEALKEVLNTPGLKTNIRIHNFGVWRQGKNDYESVDWYCEKSLNTERNQINCKVLGQLMINEPWQKHTPHHDIFILNTDIYADDLNYCFGYSIDERLAIASVNRFKKLLEDPDVQAEVFKTVLMHEIGHMFGLVNSNRRDTNDNLGLHCINECIMRQGLNMDAWEGYTYNRLSSHSPFCSNCENDLKDYFHS